MHPTSPQKINFSRSKGKIVFGAFIVNHTVINVACVFVNMEKHIFLDVICCDKYALKCKNNIDILLPTKMALLAISAQL